MPTKSGSGPQENNKVFYHLSSTDMHELRERKKGKASWLYALCSCIAVHYCSSVSRKSPSLHIDRPGSSRVGRIYRSSRHISCWCSTNLSHSLAIPLHVQTGSSIRLTSLRTNPELLPCAGHEPETYYDFTYGSESYGIDFSLLRCGKAGSNVLYISTISYSLPWRCASNSHSWRYCGLGAGD